jgi:hypothetical protein
MPSFAHNSDNIRPIIDCMKVISIADLGLAHHPVFQSLNHRSSSPPKFQRTFSTQPAILYQGIFEDSMASIGIFILPPASSLPLHDHPGMSVMSMALFGSAHIRAYDWKVCATKPAQYMYIIRVKCLGC